MNKIRINYNDSFAAQSDSTTTLISGEYNSAENAFLYYTYDSAGRVTQVYKDNLLIRRYFYDPTHGWLTREDNYDANRTYVYTYDNCGNILNRKSYLFSTAATDTLGTPLNTKTWNYQTTALGKEYLSSEYDSYDAIGNPTYFDYSMYVWDGRLLTRILEDGGALVLAGVILFAVKSKKR